MNEHAEFYLARVENLASEARESIRQAGVYAVHMGIYPFDTAAEYALRQASNKIHAVADEIDAILLRKASNAIAA